MNAWEIKNFIIQEVECNKFDINNKNIFDSKEKALKSAIAKVNQRIANNLSCLGNLNKEVLDQKSIVEYYLLKKNKLIEEAQIL
ncbi:hypothetical protein [Clostridium ljungdahlii]|uniref:Uncharacterized protein n=1 Tax=Clostridium ljungdahlii TaxID=1538 RepID=A0A168PJ25_9CLOT|nr:hypothetical protein [Clostridium ljungdahlii]OAA87808.1 hypothetical protein WY13_01923 [Clostridium ljungdahlii]